jgi:hypothetical protein
LLRKFAFQSGQFEAVHVPERLSGRILLLRCLAHAPDSPASTMMARYSVGYLATPAYRLTSQIALICAELNRRIACSGRSDTKMLY